MTTAPDYTLARNPAELWPDPMACPDFPFSTGLPGATRTGGRYSLDDARNRLAIIGAQVNAPDTELRVPTPAEIADFERRCFAQIGAGDTSQKNARFAALGFPGLRPANGEPGEVARRVMEAIHLRGYIRKLEIEAERAAQEADDAKERALRRDLQGFDAMVSAKLPELERLREAEERHLQRIADERAHQRCVELRRSLRLGHQRAIEAAAELSVDAPDLPEIRADEWAGTAFVPAMPH